MQEIPLTSIFNITAAMICLVAAFKMYFGMQENPENTKIRYFFYSFVFIAVYLFVGGLPVLIIKNSFSISVLTSLFRPFLLIGGMFLCLISLNLANLQRFEKIYVYSVFLVVLASSTLTFWGLGEVSKTSFYQQIEHWIRPDNLLITYGSLLIGVYFILSLFFAAILYFNFARKEGGVLSTKSTMIGIGCVFFMLAAICNYTLGMNPKNFILMNNIASLLFMTGTVSLISSVTYKKKEG